MKLSRRILVGLILAVVGWVHAEPVRVVSQTVGTDELLIAFVLRFMER